MSLTPPPLCRIADQGILDSLSDKERKRQEAMFEFIATEASYVRDLQLIVGVSLPAPHGRSWPLGKLTSLATRSSQMFYARLVKILDDKELVIIFKVRALARGRQSWGRPRLTLSSRPCVCRTSRTSSSRQLSCCLSLVRRLPGRQALSPCAA